MGPRAWCDGGLSGDGSQSNFALSSRVSSCTESTDSHLVLSLFEMLCGKKIKPPGFMCRPCSIVVLFLKCLGAEFGSVGRLPSMCKALGLHNINVV